MRSADSGRVDTVVPGLRHGGQAGNSKLPGNSFEAISSSLGNFNFYS